MTTQADVLGYIAAHATREDLDAFHHAFQARHKTLDATHAATVKIGAPVSLTNISPKCLTGLTGTVETIHGSRADVRLDSASTARLASTGTRRFYVPRGTEEFLLMGVPLTACHMTT